MKKTERHQIILNEVHLHNRVLLSDLTRSLNVSMDTVRRDLKELDKLKQLKKVHGGAVSNGFNIHADHSREIYEYENKSKIAKKAVSLLNHGDVILISGGSTNLEFARMLPGKMDLTFFTPSLPMAVELLNNASKNYEVHLIGGKLSRDSQLATGGSSVNILSEINADICFLGTGYLDLDKGITELDWEIAQMKRAMVNASKKLVSLTISKKLNTANRFKVCNAFAVDALVTELEPEDEQLKKYQEAGLNLL
ncbi:transcriptional regulator, DeoR family [Salegentibacter echinorum]|uniref:Transcriptional regulator, DeoR family n=1 Tax=Salegentibacter echinorum TaxID=1073325 RepID=A0A1M5E0J1_SALEC|nr:DeoR/GlpR family DNA-binding transcription regulator [Salegentibacter echinorum]SHF72592.1 transcriptional regulator, DeoR family [Salegentibacter echinorum]